MTTNNIHEEMGDGVRDPETRQLESDLANLYAVPVPYLRFSANARPAPRQREGSLRRHWRPFAGAAAAVIIAAALLIVPQVLGGGGATQVSAQTILDRANAAATRRANSLPSYHLVATFGRGDEVKAGTPDASEETWYGDATHWRTEQPGGFVQVRSENDVWVAFTGESGTRAVHGTGEALENWSMNRVGAGAAQSVGDLLAQYGEGCQVATQGADDELLGRAVYVIHVEMKPEACSRPEESEKVRMNSNDLPVSTFWFDKETYLTLRSEQTTAAGGRNYVYEVTRFDIGVAIDPATFTYAPPAGVNVAEANDWSDAKSHLAGITPGNTTDAGATNAPGQQKK
ncbi:hypothetical protein AYO38_02350 [bacterium SCGC AG-212-C10]|nr:hypothetical protein AYO38_02350 [bacterium SCGC AG-212-C10]